MRKLMILVCLCLQPAQAVAVDVAPHFSRIRLSDSIAGGQPSVVIEKDRGYVVTWQQSDGSSSSLRWMTFDLEGERTAEGVISRGDDWFVNWADTPALAVLDNGDWVAFWLKRHDSESPEGYDIKLVRSKDRGRTWSLPVSPHRDGTNTQHGFVSLIPDGEDRVLIVWLDGRLAAVSATPIVANNPHNHDLAAMTLRSAVINGDNEIIKESLIDSQTCSCCQTDLARFGNMTLLAYRDRSKDEIRDISISRRIADHQWSEPEPVHEDGWRIEGCPVNGPALAINGARSLVFWPTVVDDSMELRYKIFAADSSPVKESKVRVLASAKPPSGRVDAVPWRDGFLLIWVSRAQDSPSIDMATIDASGNATLAPPFIEPRLRGRATGFPRIAGDGTRGLVVWPELENGKPVIGIGLIK